MNEVYKFLRDKYGEGVDITVFPGDNEIRGVMYGNDKCFDENGLYQYLVDEEGNLYQCFYRTEEPLDKIDYANPYSVSNITGDFYF